MISKKLFHAIPIRNPDKIIDITNETLMCDIKTHLPSDSGYTMFLLVTNTNTRELDIVPLKTKTAKETAEAFHEMYKRRYIRNIKGCKRLICDMGSEFKGAFETLMVKLRIQLLPYNLYHKNSTSLAERAIGSVTKVLLEELGVQSLKSRRKENKWTDYIPSIVQEYNNNATPRHTLKDLLEPPVIPSNVYKLGTEVHKKLHEPVHLLNGVKKYAFRHGDRRFTTTTHTITDYRVRHGGRPISYILNNDYSIAYQHHEVLPVAKGGIAVED